MLNTAIHLPAHPPVQPHERVAHRIGANVVHLPSFLADLHREGLTDGVRTFHQVLDAINVSETEWAERIVTDPSGADEALSLFRRLSVELDAAALRTDLMHSVLGRLRGALIASGYLSGVKGDEPV